MSAENVDVETGEIMPRNVKEDTYGDGFCAPPAKFLMSNNIGKIAAALAKARGEIGAAKENAVNPHFSASYADLASIWDACQTALAKHDLAVIQLPYVHPGDAPVVQPVPAAVKPGDSPPPVPPAPKRKPPMLTLTTLICHSSGEWVSSEMSLWMPLTKQAEVQVIGSMITYMRRYALSATVGIATETDDDGESLREEQPKPAATGFGHAINQEVPPPANAAEPKKRAPTATGTAPAAPAPIAQAPVEVAKATLTGQAAQPAPVATAPVVQEKAPAPAAPEAAKRILTVKEVGPCLMAWSKAFDCHDIKKVKEKFVEPMGLKTLNDATPEQLQNCVDNVAGAFTFAKKELPEPIRSLTSIPF